MTFSQTSLGDEGGVRVIGGEVGEGGESILIRERKTGEGPEGKGPEQRQTVAQRQEDIKSDATFRDYWVKGLITKRL